MLRLSGLCLGSGPTQDGDNAEDVHRSVSVNQPTKKFTSVVKNIMLAKTVTATAVLDQEDSQEIWPATAAWFLGPKVNTKRGGTLLI